MRKFFIVAVFVVAFSVECLEVPELLKIIDDPSNDFVVSTYAPKPVTVQVVQHVPASHRCSSFSNLTFPSVPEVHSVEVPSLAGAELLELLSTRRTLISPQIGVVRIEGGRVALARMVYSGHAQPPGERSSSRFTPGQTRSTALAYELEGGLTALVQNVPGQSHFWASAAASS